MGVDAEYTTNVPLPFRTIAGMRVRNQAQMHPIVYLRGIAMHLWKQGVAIHERTMAREIHDGEPCRIVTDRGEIRAREVVVAARDRSATASSCMQARRVPVLCDRSQDRERRGAARACSGTLTIHITTRESRTSAGNVSHRRRRKTTDRDGRETSESHPPG